MPIRHRIGTMSDAQLDGDYSPNRKTDQLYSPDYLERQRLLLERIQSDKKKVAKSNPHHRPAGDERGGEFTSADGGISEPEKKPEQEFSDPATWKTPEDASAGLRKNIGLSFFHNSEDGLSDKAFVEKMRQVDTIGRDLVTRFPGLRNSGPYITGDSPLPVFEGSIVKALSSGSAGGDVMGRWNKTAHTLEIKSGLRSSDTVVPRAGAYITGETMPSVLRHELGHATESYFNRKVRENNGYGLIDMAQQSNYYPHHALFKASAATTAKTLTKYSATNAGEWFAESFAAYTHPGYAERKPGTLNINPTLKVLFDKVYKNAQ